MYTDTTKISTESRQLKKMSSKENPPENGTSRWSLLKGEAQEFLADFNHPLSCTIR
jgi:hypothetical protein